MDRAGASCGARASRQVRLANSGPKALFRIVQSQRLITGMRINLLNLQAHLRDANSTSSQNALELDISPPSL
jgi:hypothetical protein